MTHAYVSAAIGTATALAAIFLLLLRAEFQGRKPLLVLIRQWIAARHRTTGVVLTFLWAVAALSFATISARETIETHSAASDESSTVDARSSSSDTPALEALRGYANQIDDRRQLTGPQSVPPASAEVPDVDFMIAKLVARLEQQPEDAKGWKMLGWSYLNTGKPEEAASAYERALKLEPADEETKKGLEAANSARTEKSVVAPSDTTVLTNGLKLNGADRDSMIRSMVENLAQRLAVSPNDEDGWGRLMRSRMTLGETDAAKAALAKALETFASDHAASNRLTAMARELGIASDEARQ